MKTLPRVRTAGIRLLLSVILPRLTVIVLLILAAAGSSQVDAASGKPAQMSEIAAAAKAASDEANRLVALGSAQSITQAVGRNEEALRLYRLIDDRANQATILNNLGKAYSVLEEMRAALQSFGNASAICKELGDRKCEATSLLDIADIYRDLGDQQKALEYYGLAAPVLRDLGDKSLSGWMATRVGSIYGSMGAMQEAAKWHNLALALAKQSGDSVLQAHTLNAIGSTYSAIGQPKKALEYFNQALSLYRTGGGRLGSRRAEGTLLNNIGAAYYMSGDRNKAVEHYNQALAVRRAEGDLSGEADTLANLMEVWAFGSPSYPALAVFYGKQSVNRLQRLRANITGLDPEAQKVFVRSKAVIYRSLIYVLMGINRLPEAHQAINQLRDEQFFDFDRTAKRPAQELALTPHEAELSARYETAAKRVAVAGQQFDEVNGGELQAASDAFDAVLKRAEAEFARPDPARDQLGDLSDTRDLQAVLTELHRQTGQRAVAIYILYGVRLNALVVTSDKLSLASWPIDGDALNQLAYRLWTLLKTDKYDPTGPAQELYALLFKPIEPYLPDDTTTILWSLDGALRYVPMAALHDGRRYLVERYASVTFTRATRDRLLQAVSPRWEGLGLGSSKAHTVQVADEKVAFDALPGVTEELQAVFRQSGSSTGVMDGVILPDAKFTRTGMLEALRRRPALVHISSHFAFRPGDESRSFLLLGDGTAMTLAEMKQKPDLFAGVELLTLSACNTAAQIPGADGREIDGFAELAQRLGAGSVMATLWPVADKSTPWLMHDFYATRQGGHGVTKAEALRRAQVSLLNGTAQVSAAPDAWRRQSLSQSSRGLDVEPSGGDAKPFTRDISKPFAHPYYWAPFVLAGNWK